MTSQNTNYQEQALNSMFPKPVENVNEVIAKQDCIDGEEVSQEKVVEQLKVNPMRESDIFMQPKKNKQNIVLKVEDGEKNEKVTTGKKRYAHLAEARKKGAETRRRKAAERKAKKEAEKLAKEQKKAEKKAASAERNRQRARDRYYREKQEKEKVLKDGKLQVKSKPIDIPQAPVKPAGMDFNTFAEYMLKYENMKKRYKTAMDLKAIEEKKKELAKKKKEYHPENYPLAHLYNPSNRKNTTFF